MLHCFTVQNCFWCLLLSTFLFFLVPLVRSHFQVLVHHKLSNKIDHHVALWAKQHAIVHMKCTWRILPSSVVRSDVYSKMWSCFCFRRTTPCFNNKLIHDCVCLTLLRKKLHLASDDWTVFALILTLKILRDLTTSP